MKQSIVKAGFGRKDITPGLPVRLGGYNGTGRPATAINDRLNATSIFLSQNGEKVIIISLDWILIEEDDTNTIQELIKAKTGVPKQNIIITAIHSHTSPYTAVSIAGEEKETQYIEKVIPEIVASAVEASENIHPVEIGIRSTYSETGINRREIREDGTTFFGGDPAGPFDSEMTVISFKDESGIVGMIVHYGAHATAFGNVPVVSRDWPGVMVDRIESQIKAPVIFINGAIGDVGPRTNCLTKDGSFSAGGGDIDAVREVGYRAATDALHAFVKIKNYSSNIILDVIVENILYPYAPLPSSEEAKNELIKLKLKANKDFSSKYMYYYWNAVIKEHEKNEDERSKGKSFSHTILRLGDIVFIPFAAQIFSEISLRIRKTSPFQYTLCSNVTNGNMGYIPTREARHRGGYEVWLSDHSGDGYGWTEDIDDYIVKEIDKRLKKLKHRCNLK